MARQHYAVRWSHMHNEWEVYDTVSGARVALRPSREAADAYAARLNQRARR